MSQSGAERAVKQALTDPVALSPEGSAKAQKFGSTVYVAIPVEKAEYHGISQGTVLERGYHAQTETLAVALGDTPLFKP